MLILQMETKINSELQLLKIQMPKPGLYISISQLTQNPLNTLQRAQAIKQDAKKPTD